jgi:hypothetical protein
MLILVIAIWYLSGTIYFVHFIRRDRDFTTQDLLPTIIFSLLGPIMPVIDALSGSNKVLLKRYDR